jgi:arginyl-tRNA synthetase
LEGNTGPYLQYAHTRCDGILKKAKEWRENFENENLSKEEKKIIKKLIEFPDVVEQALRDFRPHYICNYAYELANIFSEFYHACPVLKAETKKLRDFRLTLVKATKITLKNSLSLLGIETPKRM